MITRDKEEGKRVQKAEPIRDLTNACKWFKEKKRGRIGYVAFSSLLAFIHSISNNSGTRYMKSVVSLLVLLYLIKIQEQASVLMVLMGYIYANRVRIDTK